MEDRELKSIIEALLFVSVEPLTLEKIKVAVEGLERKKIIKAIRELKDEFYRNGHGIQVVEVSGGYQMVTLPEYAPWIKRLNNIKKPSRLSRPGLETLAMIAYKQPLTIPEIEAVRGVDSKGVMKTLLERRLIRILGKRDTVGKPIIYGTTKEFLKYFGLNNLSDLPSLKTFKREFEIENRDIVIPNPDKLEN